MSGLVKTVAFYFIRRNPLTISFAFIPLLYFQGKESSCLNSDQWMDPVKTGPILEENAYPSLDKKTKLNPIKQNLSNT